MNRQYIPAIILHLSIVAKKNFNCNDHTITGFGIIDSKNSSTAYVILYELTDTWFLDSNKRAGVWLLPYGAGTSSPSRWQKIEEQAPKHVGWMMCFLLRTLVPVQKLCVNIYIYMHFLNEFSYRTYTYTYNRSVIQYWWSCTPSHSKGLYFWWVRCSWVECHFLLFFWFTTCVLLSDDNDLIPGCLWLMAFILNNTLILGIWCSTIPHLPGCFCPWTFFQNIGFNTVPSDPFMSHLVTQLGYSAR